MTTPEHVELFDPYKRIPHYIDHTEIMPTPIANISPAEMAGAKSWTTCLIILKRWKIIFIIGGITLLAMLSAFDFLLPPTPFFIVIYGIITTSASAGIFWMFLGNMQMRTEWPNPPAARKQTRKYALTVAPEIKKKINALVLPELESLPESAQKACRHCGIFDTDSYRACILSALEKPYFQSDKDCFAAGIFIRWQHNEPLLIIEILDQLFKCGEFHYLDANNAKETMHPVLRRSESSTSQLVVSSLAAIFEKKRPQQAGNYHASDTAELLFFNIAKVEEELKKDPIIRKHLESYYVRQKVASLKEGLSQTYEEHQCYAEHRVAGLFCLNIPVNAFFKLGGVPNPVRKAILRSLKGLPAHLELGRDILVEGHSEGMVKVMFNKDALQPVLEEIDPGKFLEKFLELKKQQGYMPGMLIPLLCSFALESINHSVSHVANAVIPKIDSLDDVKEGEGIPAVWTNWADPSQILIFKRNGKFEWLDSNGEHVNMCEMRLFDPEKNKFTPAE